MFTRSRLDRYDDMQSAAPNQHTRRGIQDEIQSALNFISEARFRQNAMLSVSRLPAEILREVFSVVSEDEEEFLRNRGDDRDRITGRNLAPLNLGWVKGILSIFVRAYTVKLTF